MGGGVGGSVEGGGRGVEAGGQPISSSPLGQSEGPLHLDKERVRRPKRGQGMGAEPGDEADAECGGGAGVPGALPLRIETGPALPAHGRRPRRHLFT